MILRSLGKPLDFQVTASEEGLDCDIRGTGPISESLRQKLIAFAVKHANSRASPCTASGWWKRACRASPSRISPNCRRSCRRAPSFRQPRARRRSCRSWRLRGLSGAKMVADLFCGLGPFSLRLARKMKVAAFDSDKARDRGSPALDPRQSRRQADNRRGARSLPPPALRAGTEALRCRAARSAAAGRGGASARDREIEARHASSMSPAIPRVSRATRKLWLEGRIPDQDQSHRSISSGILAACGAGGGIPALIAAAIPPPITASRRRHLLHALASHPILFAITASIDSSVLATEYGCNANSR